ncbi:MAG: hypothetical protein J6X86_07275 [Bacteroidales bacterium]|nr:hypothetical protein [Bacteroidales bacterium]
MELTGTNKTRLLEEAKALIERQSDLAKNEKYVLTENVEYFLSIITIDSVVKDCFWEWYNDEEEQGITLVWDWELVKGRFCICSNNSHGFNFSFGDGAWWFGGNGGEDGFYPDYDIDELELQLTSNKLIDKPDYGTVSSNIC